MFSVIRPWAHIGTDWLDNGINCEALDHPDWKHVWVEEAVCKHTVCGFCGVRSLIGRLNWNHFTGPCGKRAQGRKSEPERDGIVVRTPHRTPFGFPLARLARLGAKGEAHLRGQFAGLGTPGIPTDRWNDHFQDTGATLKLPLSRLAPAALAPSMAAILLAPFILAPNRAADAGPPTLAGAPPPPPCLPLNLFGSRMFSTENASRLEAASLSASAFVSLPFSIERLLAGVAARVAGGVLTTVLQLYPEADVGQLLGGGGGGERGAAVDRGARYLEPLDLEIGRGGAARGVLDGEGVRRRVLVLVQERRLVGRRWRLLPWLLLLLLLLWLVLRLRL
uniref:Uncharacterized protein n=1 Tax=Anopheles atroparvus TaxID=41427 RepID=A0A182IQP6_ANOAO